MWQKVTVKKEHNVLWLGMHAPDTLNAFDEIMIKEMIQVLEEAEADKEIRAIVIRGEGKGFSAGGNIQAMAEALEDTDAFFMPVLRSLNLLALRIRSIHKPVIASVHGACAGAGFNLALCCDFLISTERAKYVQAFVNLGLIPDMGGIYFLSKAVSPSRLMEWCMLGEVLPASTLYEAGLINKLVTEEALEQETAEFAAALCAKSSGSLSRTKQLTNRVVYPELFSFLQQEYEYQLHLTKQPDFREGVIAFLEKRKPTFS